MDPYKVLGVTPQTSDDDVKRAYRELARKYHPDNYVGSPLADLAETRMKEINQAYDMIMNARAGGQNGAAGGQTSGAGGPNSSAGSQSSGAGRQYGGGYGPFGSAGGPFGAGGAKDAFSAQIRDAINKGNLSLAEEMLQRSPNRNAEWYFLMGTVYFRKGWYDEARSAYMQACSMDPTNMEYRNALNMVEMGAGYGGYRPANGMSACDCCATMLCMNCCCNSCCGPGGC